MDAESIIKNLRSGHEGLDKILSSAEQYEKYLPEIACDIGIVGQYISHLRENIKNLQDDLEEIKRDPTFLSLWKDILKKIGVEAADLSTNFMAGIDAYARNYANKKALDIADKYITQLSVDLVVSLFNIGILPALIYNYLLKSINEEISYSKSLLDAITSELDTIYSGVQAVSLNGNKKDILKILTYVQDQLSSDIDINLKVLSAIESGNISALPSEWSTEKDKHYKIAMEALYPGNMMTDPEYSGEFTNYRYIYRSNISLDAIKRFYDSSSTSASFRQYLEYWSLLLKSAHNLSVYIAEYNSVISTLKLHLTNFIAYEDKVKLLLGKKDSGIFSKIINVSVSDIKSRIEFDRATIRSLGQAKTKSVPSIELYRYTQSIKMLERIKSERVSSIINNTGLLSAAFVIEHSDKEILSSLHFSMLSNVLKKYIDIAESLSFTPYSIRRLNADIEKYKNSAIFKAKEELHRAGVVMKKYKEITINTTSLGLADMDTFLNNIGATESLASMYMGDIERMVTLLTNVSGDIRGCKKTSANISKVGGQDLATIKQDIKATDSKQYKNMDIDTLKTAMVIENKQSISKMQTQLDKAKELYSKLKEFV